MKKSTKWIILGSLLLITGLCSLIFDEASKLVQGAQLLLITVFIIQKVLKYKETEI